MATFSSKLFAKNNNTISIDVEDTSVDAMAATAHNTDINIDPNDMNAIMKKSLHSMKPGDNPILNPGVGAPGNIIKKVFLPDDAPPLFLDDGHLNTDEYEYVNSDEPKVIDDPNKTSAVGERLEERISYYRRINATTNLVDDGNMITVRKLVRIMPKSVFNRRYNWKLFGEAKYGQHAPNINSYGERVFMDYNNSYLSEQIDSERLILDSGSSSHPLEQFNVIPEFNIGETLDKDLDIYNQFAKIRIRELDKTEANAPIPCFLRAPVPTDITPASPVLSSSSSTSFSTSGRHQLGGSRGRNVFVPRHLKKRDELNSRPRGGFGTSSLIEEMDKIDINIHPAERRRILREKENQLRRQGNLSHQNDRSIGRSFDNNRRNRLGSTSSIASNGSANSGSDQFGIRLYGFQTLDGFDYNDIRELLNKYGVTRVGRVFIPKDRNTGCNRNFAFVNFRSEDEVCSALDILQSERIAFDHVIIKAHRSKPRD